MTGKEYTFEDSQGGRSIVKLARERLTFGFNFGPRLAAGKTLSSNEGAEASHADGSSGTVALTVVSATINATTYNDEAGIADPIAAEEGVVVVLSGGTAGVNYDLEVYATDEDGNIKAGRVRVDVI